VKINFAENVMLMLRSVELSDANPPKAPTWRANCRCLTTDSLPRGYPGQLFGLRRVLQLDGERRDSQLVSELETNIGFVAMMLCMLTLQNFINYAT
jgi:hypothetical protein